MTVDYELTREDLAAFNFYHHFHSPTAMRQYRRSWFLPAFVWLLLCVGIWYRADKSRGTPLRTFLDLLPLFSGVPLYLLYFPWAYRLKLRRIIRGMVNEGRNRGLFTHHRVVTSLDGIEDSTDAGQMSMAWRAIERVGSNDQYAFVYINSLAAIIVPRRAFAGPEKFEDFVQAANDHHKKAVT